jgi:hypothetical protein
VREKKRECVRERERGRKREIVSGSEKERDKKCVFEIKCSSGCTKDALFASVAYIKKTNYIFNGK